MAGCNPALDHAAALAVSSAAMVLPGPLAPHVELRRPPLCPEISVHEARSLVPLWEAAEALAGCEVEPPFWAFAWPGGQALARHVLDHPALVRGKAVIDLGCGNGLAALAAARAGARVVIANDIDPAAIEAVRENGRANGLHPDALLEDLLLAPPGVPPAEVILAGDMFYARALAARAEPWLREAAGRGALVLAGDPGRAYAPAAGVEELARYQVPVSLDVERSTPLATRVLRFLPG
jgi:predicted nicotinamide N-methyase